jgi:hypothetical protein
MENPRRLWAAVVVAFVAGIGAVVAGLLMTKPGVGIACEAARQYKTCTSRVIGEELVYTGFALLTFALLTAVAALGRSEPHR